MKKFYLTTPLYYPNARLHAGHAYTTLVCDALARYKRQCGFDVAFLTGTDEHGEKLERAATEAGKTPQVFVAEKREQIKRLWKLLDISITHFIYTDRADHTLSVQRLLSRARERDPNVIYKTRYEGRYCIFDERYLSEGTEPVNCDVCGRPGELITEDNWFFRLSAFQARLLEHYDQHPEFVRPEYRLNEVKSFVKSGLRDISVSRKRIKWGVPWPDDPEQVFYVWYDALTGYMTGIGYGEAEGGSAEFRKYWPADVHMIGKDIIRFHAVYWPAFLMAAAEPLPKQIVAHGWLLVGEDKMSKSKGNAVYAEPVCKFFESETHGVVAGSDVLRYYALRDVLFGQDGSITYESLIRRTNSDLANDLGNLVNRTLTMISQYSGGNVYPPGDLTAKEMEIEKLVRQAWDKYQSGFDSFAFSQALDAVWSVVAKLNQYLVENRPWMLAQSSGAAEALRLKTVLSTVAGALRILTVLLAPVLPNAAERIWKQLGQTGSPGEAGIRDDPIKPVAMIWDPWMGHISKPEIIFPRLDKTSAVKKLEALSAAEQEGAEPTKKGMVCMDQHSDQKPGATSQAVPSSQSPAPSPGSSPAPRPVPVAPSPAASDQKITIEDFAKVDLCVGEVLSAEPVPNATKLLKLMVDIGTEVRQVVAGIAEYYKPEQLVGMKVVLVTNLQPRKLRGVESNGMIVAATVGPEGRPVLATFKEDVPKGSKLK